MAFACRMWRINWVLQSTSSTHRPPCAYPWWLMCRRCKSKGASPWVQILSMTFQGWLPLWQPTCPPWCSTTRSSLMSTTSFCATVPACQRPRECSSTRSRIWSTSVSRAFAIVSTELHPHRWACFNLLSSSILFLLFLFCMFQWFWLALWRWIFQLQIPDPRGCIVIRSVNNVRWLCLTYKHIWSLWNWRNQNSYKSLIHLTKRSTGKKRHLQVNLNCRVACSEQGKSSQVG